jgi:tyrosine-protein kinase Etk/Wzc
MPSRTPASPDEIQMSSVFDALKRSARWLVLLSVLLGAATFGVLSLMAPRYQSEAELAIVAKGASSTFSDPRSMSAGPDLVTTRMDKEAINTHVRAMQSPELLEQIAKDLKLSERREFNSVLGPVDPLDAILRLVGIGGPRSGESERDRVLAAFRSRLEVYSAKESRFIGVRMTSIDSDLAARIANAIAENYRASLAEQGVSEIDDLQSVLQAKIDKLSTEVANAETGVDRYRGQIDGFSGGAQNTGLNDQQMSDLTAELTRAKAARGEAEARAQSAREMMKAGTADTLADVQKSPLIQNLVQQRIRIEREISELSATLLPGHPRMRQLNADLSGLKLQINTEISKIVAGLDKEAKVAQGREDSIKQSLADLKARVVTNAPEEAQLRQLDANARAKRTELENLQGQLEANRKRLDMRAQPVEAQIISKAQPESVPVFPKKIQLSTLMGVASLMFGTAWVVMGSLFQGMPAQGPRRRTAADRVRAEPSLTARQQEPLLREMTELDKVLIPEVERPALSHFRTGPLIALTFVGEEEVEALAEHLKARRPAEGGHRTLITGASEEIVPFDEAVELVQELANSGAQTILVDWSPSGDGIENMIHLDTVAGLNELLSGDARFDDIIQRLPGTAAHVVACGGASDNPDGDIDPDQLNLVLDALDEAYDHIVVVGRHDEARKLFEAIEGRFDAGITVAYPHQRPLASEKQPGTFLGFEVADIDIVHFVRREVLAPAVTQRITRATQQHVPMARRA